HEFVRVRVHGKHRSAGKRQIAPTVAHGSRNQAVALRKGNATARARGRPRGSRPDGIEIRGPGDIVCIERWKGQLVEGIMRKHDAHRRAAAVTLAALAVEAVSRAERVAQLVRHDLLKIEGARIRKVSIAHGEQYRLCSDLNVDFEDRAGLVE